MTSVPDMRRSLAALVTLLSLATVAAACSSEHTVERTPVRLASIASASGTAAAYGVNAQRGVRLAVDQLGDGLIELRTFDDQSTNDGAMTAARTAIDWGATAVFAPTLSPVALTVAPMFTQNRIPTFGVSNATIDLGAAGDYFWRVSKSEADMVSASVNAATRRGQRAVLVWEPADGYSVGSRDAFVAAAAARGVTIVKEYEYVDGRTTPATLLASASTQSPDAVFMALRSAVAATFLSATVDLAPVRIGGNGFNSAPVIASAGSSANDLVVSGSWNIDEPVLMSEAFVAAYRAAYGSAPDSFAAQGYAAVQVLLAAVRAGGGTSAPRIQRGLGRLGTATNDAATVLGRFGYTTGHEPTYPAVVQQVRSGMLVPFR